MGAVSSCCAVEESEDRQVMKENGGAKASKSEKSRDDRKKNGKYSKSRSSGPRREGPAVTAEQIEDLNQRLLSGMAVLVLLQDGTRLSCVLHYNAKDASLSISCEDKVRVIPLSDIKALLHTHEQLQRVETKANLVDDECCVALHLLESGNCIPLRFENVVDKCCFVDLVKQIKA
ncbi:IMC sub-compartment protein ISP1 [Besnoitia besnoiti]|uniref:IMC sub-compartment protein ISP1 n=1 Tax=Besnoitia besnoiti TaxID=94643 RepID=A0A2A9M807_BESBE|nr:IMC sub-compartment protein ISP1 [Besnoitia besnoiti]PFH33304.1 IMC sub-compartment protein ISP1 [Besnoitia besnoiti]